MVLAGLVWLLVFVAAVGLAGATTHSLWPELQRLLPQRPKWLARLLPRHPSAYRFRTLPAWPTQESLHLLEQLLRPAMTRLAPVAQPLPHQVPARVAAGPLPPRLPAWVDCMAADPPARTGPNQPSLQHVVAAPVDPAPIRLGLWHLLLSFLLVGPPRDVWLLGPVVGLRLLELPVGLLLVGPPWVGAPIHCTAAGPLFTWVPVTPLVLGSCMAALWFAQVILVAVMLTLPFKRLPVTPPPL